MPAPFTTDYPSSILRDFQFWLDALSVSPAPLTPSQNLGRQWLFATNAKMPAPQIGVTEKSDQKYYPLFHMFYWICLDSGLCSIKAGGKKPVFELNPDKANSFRQLSPEGQYFFLLETYLTRCDWGLLDESSRFGPEIHLRIGLPQIASFGVGVKVPTRYPSPYSFLLGYHGLYFQYFGIWNVEREQNLKDYPKSYFHFKTIALSEWGKFFLQRVVDENLHTNDLIEDLEEEEFLALDLLEDAFLQSPKRLHEYFTEDFPAGVFAGMPVLVEPKATLTGNYIFKVSLKYEPAVWRKIKMRYDDNLEDLHDMIQEAFNFDNDHLFRFYLNPRSDRRDVFNGPAMFGNEAPYACEAIIGELGFTAGQKFRYLFDFGDNWEFDIVLETIEEDKTAVKKAVVVEKQGKAPKQY